jgi:hypothetical protein
MYIETPAAATSAALRIAAAGAISVRACDRRRTVQVIVWLGVSGAELSSTSRHPRFRRTRRLRRPTEFNVSHTTARPGSAPAFTSPEAEGGADAAGFAVSAIEACPAVSHASDSRVFVLKSLLQCHALRQTVRESKLLPISQHQVEFGLRGERQRQSTFFEHLPMGNRMPPSCRCPRRHGSE